MCSKIQTSLGLPFLTRSTAYTAKKINKRHDFTKLEANSEIIERVKTATKFKRKM